MRVLAFALVLVLGACGAVQPETYPQRVYQVQGGYNAIASLAVSYVELPLCTVPFREDPVHCAEPGAVRIIKQADMKAYTALNAAKAAIGGPDENQMYRLADLALNELRAALVRYAITEAKR